MTAIVVLVGCVVGVLAQLATLRGLLGTPRLRALAPAAPAAWPRLSIVVPAHDEARSLRAAVETLLAQDHPELELVLVDDRSTDGTGAIVDALAAADARVVPVHVETLPPGWLGKVHALAEGARRASGEWLLFTDADVHFAPGLLRRAHALALGRGLDHLTIFPAMTNLSPGAELCVAAFGQQLLATSNAPDVGKPGSRAFVGIGAFNLVRRAALARTPGFEWLKLEVADDLGLAMMLRDAGAARLAVLGEGDVWLQWYPTLRAMLAGLEKNLFGVAGRYSVARALGTIVLVAAAALSPLVAPFVAWRALRAVVAVEWLLTFVIAALMRTRLRAKAWPSVLWSVGSLLMAYAVARSTWRTLRDGGVTWGGVRYPLSELRAGMRLRWGGRSSL